jgi:putative acetyltransferase
VIAIRPSRSDDTAAMWAIRTRAVRIGCVSHYAPAEIASWSASPPPASYVRLLVGGGGIVAESATGMAGFALLDVDSGEVDALFVDPSHARMGIGQCLMHELVGLARERRLPHLHLYASLNAVDFYKRAGFVPVRDELYAHPSGIALACVLMERDID